MYKYFHCSSIKTNVHFTFYCSYYISAATGARTPRPNPSTCPSRSAGSKAGRTLCGARARVLDICGHQQISPARVPSSLISLIDGWNLISRRLIARASDRGACCGCGWSKKIFVNRVAVVSRGRRHVDRPHRSVSRSWNGMEGPLDPAFSLCPST